MISRRKFVTRALLASGAAAMLPMLHSCRTRKKITGKILGPDAALGHRLRKMDFPPPTEERKADVVIVGGGIAGLSAARYLNQHSSDFLLLELGDEVGGNSIGGKNQITAYPWGAHYLPLPGNNDQELLRFLKEADVITGEKNGVPVFNEYYLCFDPKERLYINNYWQDGLIPNAGIPQKDRIEIERFNREMHAFKQQRGQDGREAFAIPLDFSSQDKSLLALDSISMAQYLASNNYQSDYLKWYVNYCCADDFGASMEDVSAWAGIHYFASRKGMAANADADVVLTWPEGNFFLARALRKDIEPRILTKSLVYKVEPENDRVVVTYFDASRNISISIISDKVILATPQYVTQRILAGNDSSAFRYAPWMIANITLDSQLNERRGTSLCWDNVFYGSESIGYVNANHQHISIKENRKVLTYYLPLTGADVRAARMAAFERTYDDWLSMILTDLKKPHPRIEEQIENIDIRIWGHGMIRPDVGFIWGEDRRKYIDAQTNRILKAHSDMSGISIFEEAFYRGHIAAKKCLGMI